MRSVKYCDKCCRQYRVKWTDDKQLTHVCSPSKCPHCSAILIDEEEHSCDHVTPRRDAGLVFRSARFATYFTILSVNLNHSALDPS